MTDYVMLLSVLAIGAFSFVCCIAVSQKEETGGTCIDGYIPCDGQCRGAHYVSASEGHVVNVHCSEVECKYVRL